MDKALLTLRLAQDVHPSIAHWVRGQLDDGVKPWTLLRRLKATVAIIEKERSQAIAPRANSFGQLPINATFDWVDPAPGAKNSFFLRCRKTGPRSYVAIDISDAKFTVGSANARVFHVEM